MTCTANGIAIAGQYSNLGTATAEHPTFGSISATDLSHYFGQVPGPDLDFGDAPASYATTLADDGARHVLGSGVYLGACVDAEADGQPSPGATGDDLAAGLATFGTCATAGDDEDGVSFAEPLVPGSTADVVVVANEACTLSAWADFSGDGDWGDAGEDLFPGGVPLAAGANPLQIAVPATAVAGATFARFRCTTDGAVGVTGEASDGEVEDYVVTVRALSVLEIPTATGTALLALGMALAGLGFLALRRLAA